MKSIATMNVEGQIECQLPHTNCYDHFSPRNNEFSQGGSSSPNQ
jgi:hypothetical protein